MNNRIVSVFFCIILLSFATIAVRAADFIVTTSEDRDGTCISNANCSLREAVKAANASPGDDNIYFPEFLDGQTFSLTLGTQLLVSPNGGKLSVVGARPYSAHIRGVSSRIFRLEQVPNVDFRPTLELVNLRLSGGVVPSSDDGGAVASVYSNLIVRSCWFDGNRASDGGGIMVWSGAVTISDSIFTNNTAVFGGGFSVFAADVLIERSSFVGNRSTQLGGAIYLGDPSAVIRNVTISGNNSDEDSAGIHVRGTGGSRRTVLEYVTVTNNRAFSSGAGGLGCDGQQFSVRMSIFHGNRNTSFGLTNPDVNATCRPIVGTSIVGPGGPDPLLGPLTSDGGPSYHLLSSGSPAIDREPGAEAPPTDIRGKSRRADGDGDGVLVPDYGAVEAANLVTNTSDDFRVGSLRQVINNAEPNSDIRFDPNHFGVARVLELTNGELLISKNLSIFGPGANLLAIAQTGSARVMNIQNGSVLNLSGVLMTDGLTSGNGGAIYNNGTLNLDSSILSGNTAAFGGGIYNDVGRTANIRNSIIRSNFSNGGAGGIGNSGTVSVYGSTLSSNTATFGGAAVAGPMMILNNTTLSGNVARTNKAGGVYIGVTDRLETTNATISNNFSNAELAGGIFSDGGVFQARNTIVAGNFGGFAGDVAGQIYSFGYNLIGSTAGNSFAGNSPNLTGNIVNVAANLAPLGNYGGPSPTHALLPNSPAINAGDPGTSVFLVDQRGAPRPVGAPDIGAFERNIVVSPDSLPAGEQSGGYSQNLTASRLINQLADEEIVALETDEKEAALAPFTFAVVPVSGQGLPPGLTLASNGTLSGVPTTTGTFTFTVAATDADGMAGVAQYTIAISANLPPTITPVAVSQQSGSAASRQTIATVSDAQSGPSGVTVTITSPNPSNGVTVSSIGNTNGTIAANILAACGATTATFTLTARDSGGATSTATLTVTVIPNATPVVGYPGPHTVGFGGQLIIQPSATGDNGTVSYSIESVTPTLVPSPIVNSNGVVTINGPQTVGSFTVTVRVTDNCGAFSTGSFALTVNAMVNKTADTDDGICDGDCSLREAIATAPPGATIVFSPIFNNPQTIALSSPLVIDKNLTISGPTAATLTIDSQNLLDVRAFDINAGSNVSVGMSNLLITRGNVRSYGGGIMLQGGATLDLTRVRFENNFASIAGGAIYASNSKLNIYNSRITDNRTAANGLGGGVFLNGGEFLMRESTVASNNAGSNGAGGGIGSQGANALRIEASTISGNTARNGGGVNASGGNVSVSNSTVSGNSASVFGGGFNIFSSATLGLRQATVASNLAGAGGGIANETDSSVNIANSIVGDNSAGSNRDVFNGGTINAFGKNLIEDGSFGGTLNGGATVMNVDPQLSPLADNGGWTFTQEPALTSPVLNAAVNAESLDTSGNALVNDQRGLPRFFNTTADIGAFEIQTAFAVVTNDLDSGAGSLRQAIADAPSGSTIAFSPTFFNQPRTISLQSTIAINKNLTINGPGAGLLTIDGENRPGLRLFVMDGGFGTVNMRNLRLIRGNVTTVGQGGGGAIFVRRSSLNLTNVIIEDNSAVDSGGGISAISAVSVSVVNSKIINNRITNGGEGGGFYANGSDFQITDTIVSGNTASNGGGLTFVFATLAKIDNSTINGNDGVDGGGMMILASVVRAANVTISGNNATNRGGGTYVGSSNTFAVFRNATIARNSAAFAGGGLYLNPATNIGASIANTIIGDNSSIGGRDVWNSSGFLFTLFGPNIVESGIDGNGSLNGGGTAHAVDARLSPLGNYGGATPTHSLDGGSPAIDAGLNPNVLDANGGVPNFDQRGIGAPRIIGGTVDLGAFERNISYVQTSLPNGGLNFPYTAQLSATRQASLASAPTAFEIVAIPGESLPPGITLSTGGLLAGTPTVAGNYRFTVKATDTDGFAGTQSFGVDVLVPTAANIAIGGRVSGISGGVRNAIVTLTTSDGVTRSVRTNSFGQYRFADLSAGETYVVTVSSKRMRFSPASRVVTVKEDALEVNFEAAE